MEGRGMKHDNNMKKDMMGAGEHPSSHKDPMGKGQEAMNKTSDKVYSKCAGVCEEGIV